MAKNSGKKYLLNLEMQKNRNMQHRRITIYAEEYFTWSKREAGNTIPLGFREDIWMSVTCEQTDQTLAE